MAIRPEPSASVAPASAKPVCQVAIELAPELPHCGDFLYRELQGKCDAVWDLASMKLRAKGVTRQMQMKGFCVSLYEKYGALEFDDAGNLKGVAPSWR